uniref:Uncharacterized protein n=1 Tax=Kalanchoe fedtschenkoi TaxID=63787 RepID=A0A7N0U6B6_KALFE
LCISGLRSPPAALSSLQMSLNRPCWSCPCCKTLDEGSAFQSSSLSGSNRSHLWLLFSVLGAPLAPVHVSYGEPLPHLSIKDTPIEASSAHHILHQDTVASEEQKV